MKIKVNSKALLEHLVILARMQNTKNTLPILDCILFDVKDSELHLYAGSVENQMACTVDIIESNGNGRMALMSRTLIASIKEIGDQPIDIELCMDNSVIITYLNGHYSMMSMDANDYPISQSHIFDIAKYSVDSNIVKRGLSACLFATAQNDELRPQMNGVFVDTSKSNKLIFVGSDGHKLVRDTWVHAGSEDSRTSGFILDIKSSKALLDMIGKKEHATVGVSVTNDNRYATFTCDEYTLNCLLIDHKYPNYESVIPTASSFNAIVGRMDILGAIRRTLTFADATTSKIVLSFATDNIKVKATDIDFSTSAEEDVQCEYNASPITIGFDGRCLKEMISQLESENIQFAMTDATRAAILTPVGQNADEDLTMLLMPMMI